jgi:hypothetical protein
VLKPTDFLMNMVGFFAILLPGAIVAALMLSVDGVEIFRLAVLPANDALAKWAAFIVLAYILGHLVFLVGSWVDPAYDFFRECFDPYDEKSPFTHAKAIRDSLLDRDEWDAVNPFQWCKAVLIQKCPAAATDVEQYEADSKFFRSLLVVGLVVAVAMSRTGDCVAALIAIIFSIASFVRYYDRRLKSTTQAYVHIITMHRLGNLVSAKSGGAA